MQIKAYAAKSRGGILKPFSYERDLGDRDVLINITHCGIAQGDIHFINDDWGETKYPLVPGHEIIGIVEETGSRVTQHRKGDRVGVGYQLSACFECEHCKTGNEQFCLKQEVIGVNAFGGCAEQIIVDRRFAFQLPDIMDSATSIPLLSSGLTVFTAIQKAKLLFGSSTAVLGVGGLGHLATQFLIKMGHRVSALSRTADKQTMIEKLGATYIDITKYDLTSLNRTFDYIISTANTDFDLDTYLKMLKPQGKFCLVGLPLTKLSFMVPLLADYAQRTIYGNYIGSINDMHEMLKFSVDNNVESVVEIMPFAKMNEAIEKVKQKKVEIRLVLENQNSARF